MTKKEIKKELKYYINKILFDSLDNIELYWDETDWIISSADKDDVLYIDVFSNKENNMSKPDYSFKVNLEFVSKKDRKYCK
jgi:hypothetical protein